MPDPNPFHVDAPEAQPTPDQPQGSPVNHDDVQAALSDALGVPAEEVKTDEPDYSAPSSGRPISEMLAERQAKLAAESYPSDPFPEQRTQKAPPFDRNPSWAGEAIPSPPPKAQVAQAAPVHPFADRARISQSIKMAIAQATSGFPDVEVEGLHILAQLVSQIVTSEPDKAREIWMQIGKHCDDVAAALR